VSDFSDVGDFHRKFGLPAVADAASADRARPRTIEPELRDFRLRFLLEELEELAEGYGLELNWSLDPRIKICPTCNGRDKDCTECCNGSVTFEPEQDLPQIADALVDLVYVALGTSHLHGFPWPVLWNDVQRANMSKERCGIDHTFIADVGEEWCLHPLDESTVCGKHRSAHSLRGSAFDVIKPAGWIGPRTLEVLMEAGWPGPPLPL